MKPNLIFLGGQINAVSLPDAAPAETLSRLSVGELVRAQIIRICADELILRLFDGTAVTAKSLVPVEAREGEMVELVVKENDNGRVLLETVKRHTRNDARDEAGLKEILKKADIPPTRINMEIARHFVQNGMKVDKAAITMIAGAIEGFGNDLPIKEAFFLQANNMEISGKSIKSLKMYVNGNIRIDRQLSELEELLGKIQDTGLVRDVLRQVEGHETAKIVEARQSADEIVKTQGSADIKDGLENAEQYGKPVRHEGESVKHEAGKPVKGGLIEDSTGEIPQRENALRNPAEMPQSVKKESTADKNTPAVIVKTSENPEVRTDLKTTPADRVLTDMGRGESREADGSGGDKVAVRSADTKTAAPDADIKVSKGQDGPKAFFDMEGTPGKEAGKHIQDDNGIENRLKELFGRFHAKVAEYAWPGEELDPGALYKDIIEKLQIIKRSIRQSDIPSKTEVISTITRIEENINFMNLLNSHAAYIQIPLSMWNGKTTGELYVLKRGGKKRIDPNNASLAISLKTAYLGLVEAFVNLFNKSLSVNIRVENKETADFIKRFSKELYDALREKGYNLVEFKCRLAGEPVNVLNVRRVAEDVRSGYKCSVDVKV